VADDARAFSFLKVNRRQLHGAAAVAVAEEPNMIHAEDLTVQAEVMFSLFDAVTNTF